MKRVDLGLRLLGGVVVTILLSVLAYGLFAQPLPYDERREAVEDYCQVDLSRSDPQPRTWSTKGAVEYSTYSWTKDGKTYSYKESSEGSRTLPGPKICDD